jgi:hypothetical protein
MLGKCHDGGERIDLTDTGRRGPDFLQTTQIDTDAVGNGREGSKYINSAQPGRHSHPTGS